MTAVAVVSRAALLALVLAGCADPNLHADAMAQTAHLRRAQVTTDSFVLTSFYRITRPDLPLTVYIEGDGLAWRSRTEPSADPTPHQALGLALAAADPAANVVYLARPCQFTPMAANPRCDKAYWTNKRFADESGGDPLRRSGSGAAHSSDWVFGRRRTGRVDCSPAQRCCIIAYRGR